MWNKITPVVATVLAAVPLLRAEPPRIAVMDTRVISFGGENCHGWPTLAHRTNGQSYEPALASAEKSGGRTPRGKPTSSKCSAFCATRRQT